MFDQDHGTIEPRRYWWVNHKKTHRQEVAGGYLWSPKKNRKGSRNVTYDNMQRAERGDTVFSYADGHIRAIGIVRGRAASARKPAEFGRAGKAWSNKLGWRVDVDFRKLVVPLKPREHMKVLAPLLPLTHSPIRKNGIGNQGTYLAAVSVELANALRALLGETTELGSPSAHREKARERAERAAVERILADRHLKPTTKKRLTEARLGQGEFRKRVEAVEMCCRVTGITDRRFLRASHIRPWCKSNNRQRLDGNNGLLLAPHIDHLFDLGYITFTDTGKMKVSRSCASEILKAFGIELPINVGPFNAAQCVYLAYHRRNEFDK